MAYLSPGAYVVEVDASAIVPTVSNSVAFFAGNFTKGPIEQPFMVTNKTDLESYFGQPTNQNYNEWFQCYKFLDYGNQLVISRGFTEGIPVINSATIFTDFAIDGADEAVTSCRVTAHDKIDKGSILTFGSYVDDKYQVESINTSVVGDVSLTIKALQTGSSYTATAGTEVTVIEKTQNSQIEIEIVGGTATQADDYAYTLIKNEVDFEFVKDTIPFYGAQAKLKFIGKTAESSKLDIAIVSSSQFDDVSGNPTQAEAFEGLSINNYFQYPPVGDDFGVIIRNPDTNVIESFVCSSDQAAIDGNNRSKYVETVINEGSRLVYCVENLAQDDAAPTNKLYKDSAGVVVNSVVSTDGGNSPTIDPVGDVKNAYDEVLNKELFEIDIVIGNELNPNAAISLATERADCIAFVGAEYGDVVGKKSAVATDNLIKKIKANTYTRSMFGSFFGNYVKIYDNFAKKFRWINIAGDVAGLRADTNTNLASWWASAGLKRGILRNITSLAFSPDQAQRDDLYKNSINPVVSFPGEGNLVFGQKTLLNYASAFDRINVRGLFNTIERAMAKAARSEVFEFNDVYTRNAILAMFNPYLSSVRAARGVENFMVVCDTTNNTADVISRNELHVDIYIKPSYAAEYIQLTFTNVGTRSFASVIGA